VSCAEGGVDEWLRDGRTGIRVPPRDIKALADAMGTLIDNELLADRLGAEGRVLVEQEFSVGETMDRLLNLYAKTTNEFRFR